MRARSIRKGTEERRVYDALNRLCMERMIYSFSVAAPDKWEVFQTEPIRIGGKLPLRAFLTLKEVKEKYLS